MQMEVAVQSRPKFPQQGLLRNKAGRVQISNSHRCREGQAGGFNKGLWGRFFPTLAQAALTHVCLKEGGALLPKCNDQICKFKGTSSLAMGTQAYSCLHASFGPPSLPALALRTQECDHTDWDVEEKLKNRVLAFFFNLREGFESPESEQARCGAVPR